MAASLRLRGAASGLRYWNRRQRPAAASLAAVCSRSMASKTPVGFIGLGNMGNPMAKNLMKHGYPLIIYDVFPDACKEFQDAGEQVVSSPADVAEKADRIITMLPTSINAIEAYSGANGILKKVKKGSLLIDSSTIDPAVSKELAKEVEKMGAVFMDAPVSGGVGAARSGNLTFMVGGVEDEFAAAQELLGCMGSNVVYCGAVGTGQAAKICNNMLLAISMIGTAEAMNLGIRLGLDPKLLAKILNMSSGRCWSSDTYNPVPGVMDGVPSANNYQGGFGATLMAKTAIHPCGHSVPHNGPLTSQLSHKCTSPLCFLELNSKASTTRSLLKIYISLPWRVIRLRNCASVCASSSPLLMTIGK